MLWCHVMLWRLIFVSTSLEYKNPVDGSEIPFPATDWMVLKPCKKNGINYQPQLVIARFLNHQQYEWSIHCSSPFTASLLQILRPTQTECPAVHTTWDPPEMHQTCTPLGFYLQIYIYIHNILHILSYSHDIISWIHYILYIPYEYCFCGSGSKQSMLFLTIRDIRASWVLFQ